MNKEKKKKICFECKQEIGEEEVYLEYAPVFKDDEDIELPAISFKHLECPKPSISPIMEQIYKNTPIVTKHYTIDSWMESLAMKLVNELLNNVTVFEGDNEVLFVCPECGECLTE